MSVCERRPRRQLAVAHDAGLDQHPRAVADRGDRLALLEEVADERDGVLVAAQLVGVADAAGHHQRVVVVGGDLLDRPVDLHRARPGRSGRSPGSRPASARRARSRRRRPSSASRGCSSSTRSNMSAARIATRLPCELVAHVRLLPSSPFCIAVPPVPALNRPRGGRTASPPTRDRRLPERVTRAPRTRDGESGYFRIRAAPPPRSRCCSSPPFCSAAASPRSRAARRRRCRRRCTRRSAPTSRSRSPSTTGRRSRTCRPAPTRSRSRTSPISTTSTSTGPGVDQKTEIGDDERGDLDGDVPGSERLLVPVRRALQPDRHFTVGSLPRPARDDAHARPGPGVRRPPARCRSRGTCSAQLPTKSIVLAKGGKKVDASWRAGSTARGQGHAEEGRLDPAPGRRRQSRVDADAARGSSARRRSRSSCSRASGRSTRRRARRRCYAFFDVT